MSSVSEWHIIEKIGVGSTCSVYLAQHTTTRVLSALKVFKSTAALNATEEINIHKSLQHPRISDFVGSFSCVNRIVPSESTAILVTEYASKGDLFNLIETVGRVPEKIARTYFTQILDALSYLHSQHICHLDVKPENIFLDNNCGAKLADFGISKKLTTPDQLLRDRVGSVFYTSPEKLEGNGAYDGFKADLFALGVTLFTMVNGGVPFEKADKKDEFYNYIIEGDNASFWEGHQDPSEENIFSQDFIDLINRMIAFNPEDRLSLEEVKAHRWTQGAVLDDKELKNEVTQLLLNSSEDA